MTLIASIGIKKENILIEKLAKVEKVENKEEYKKKSEDKKKE